ncbi:MAG: biotin transporter BioY [Cyanobacteria bacterium CRU_2_1]|nr:biotin transporter BioY [Cyanobacteria bacterium RU_5_0]NJR60959.1 biotin transporter BioY [Cyanobacteria bacterium CRU_2_1]
MKESDSIPSIAQASISNPQSPISGLKLAAPTQLMWALIGLLLTIGGTLLEAFVTTFPWQWGQYGVQVYSLGVTCQIGAVLLIGCLGGRNAAAISQVAYLLLGLTWFNVFTQGGGLDYTLRPSFGYLLGFIPGAWICGWLAFRLPVRLECLALSSLSGLFTIHFIGIGYFLLARAFGWANLAQFPLLPTLLTYSIQPLPGQLAVLCAVTVIAFVLRHLMFY